MKNILQKLYYYSPYIPIIGLFTYNTSIQEHTCLARDEYGDVSQKHLSQTLFIDIASIISVIIFIIKYNQ